MKKGESFSLRKAGSGHAVTHILIGLGWESAPQVPFDLDLSAFLLTDKGMVRDDNDCVFYNSALKRPDGSIPSSCGSVVHGGDALVGRGDGDDEVITVALESVPPEIAYIVLFVTIYRYRERRQLFADGNAPYVRVVDQTSGSDEELERFNLGEAFGESSAMHVGTLARRYGYWEFRAVGDAKTSGLARIAHDYGVSVGKNSLEQDL